MKKGRLMKWMLMFLLVAGTGVMVTSCSSDDEVESIVNGGEENGNGGNDDASDLQAKALAEQSIAGKWLMTGHSRVLCPDGTYGRIENDNGPIYEFLANGKLLRPFTNDNEGETTILEGEYKLKDDWKTEVIDGVEVLTGRIVSNVLYPWYEGEGECVSIVYLQGDKLIMTPDCEAMGIVFAADPSEEFVRVK